ncbi:MAG: hypothetical protein HYR85_05680 [Planctomycetes bacterium]|nr:hypothetical protein [Planctomycetota bacterium]MBI3848291.1 hypothetical protein [Planctomycetota bacterium]
MFFVTRRSLTVVPGSLFALLVMASCSGTPSIDSQLLPKPREYPRRKPIEGIRDTQFDTSSAMYASAELLRGTGRYFDRFTDLAFDDLRSEKSVEDSIKFDALWMARYNIETLDWVSGMGVPLADADARIARLLAAAGIKNPPVRNPLPVYLPFAAGDPHYTMKVDLGDPNAPTPPNAATMRFEPSRTDRTLRPDAVAMTLWAEVELARVLLSGTHSLDASGKVVQLGLTGDDLFEGLLLLTLASEKARALKDQLLRAESFSPPESAGWPILGKTLAGRIDVSYLPHRLAVTQAATSGSLGLQVIEPVSYLGDLATVLLAASELADASAPSPQNTLAPFFAAGGSIDESTHDVAVLVANVALQSIVQLHDDPELRAPISFVSRDERGKTILTTDAALLLIALQSFRAHVGAVTGNAMTLEHKLQAFLLDAQYDDGSYSAAYDIETLDAAEPRWFAAGVQGLAIRGLLVAFETTGDFNFRRAAIRTQRQLDGEEWLLDRRLYRSEELIASGMKFSRYTPTIVGAVASGLRELSLATHESSYAKRYVEFVTGNGRPAGVLHCGLLTSELAATGEKSPDARDGDTDGILNAPFADGPFGVAPVFAREIVIPTP